MRVPTALLLAPRALGVASGSPSRQEFPVDAESRVLFEREGLTASLANAWAIEIVPGRMFTCELARPARLSRVEFDLANAVATPPVAGRGFAPEGPCLDAAGVAVVLVTVVVHPVALQEAATVCTAWTGQDQARVA